MTPQEKDLITSLLGRLQQTGNQPQDPEAADLIGRAMAAQPGAPYFLVQTVLIQDMALNEAQNRIKDLEQQLAAAKNAPSAAAPSSFLSSALRGSVPSAGAGPWGHTTPPAPAPAAATSPVWTQSSAGGAPPPAPPYGYPQQAPMMSPLTAPGAGSGFLRQAATTAAGVAGGALLFEGIQSLFGHHYGSSFMSGMPMQPGLGETVINNYYGGDGDAGYPAGGSDASGVTRADADYGQSGWQPQDVAQNDSDQDIASSQDFGSDQDLGGSDDFNV